jgi:hypothetical protein
MQEVCLALRKPRPRNYSRKGFPRDRGHIKNMPPVMREYKEGLKHKDPAWGAYWILERSPDPAGETD